MSAKRWTEEQCILLETLHKQGKTYSQISRIFGGAFTRCAVAAKVHKMRAKLAPREPESSVDINALAEAWKNPDLTSTKIADIFGISPSHVRGISRANPDLFAPRTRARKKPEAKPTNRVVSAWSRRDPSLPTPDSYKPIPMDAYETERLPYAKLLHELDRNECKWPLGDDRPYRFCACKTTQAGTYCAHHAVKAAGVGTKPERDATKIGGAA